LGIPFFFFFFALIIKEEYTRILIIARANIINLKSINKVSSGIFKLFFEYTPKRNLFKTMALSLYIL